MHGVQTPNIQLPTRRYSISHGISVPWAVKFQTQLSIRGHRPYDISETRSYFAGG